MLPAPNFSGNSMKTHALATAAAGLLALACLLHQPLLGQVVTDYSVWKLVVYNQTDVNTTNLRSSLAYYFMAGISGTNLQSLTPTPSVVIPNGTAAGTPSLALDPQNQWGKFTGYANSTALNNAYGNSGTYTLNIDGTHTLGGALDTSSTPFLAPAHITNGTWSTGALQVDPFSDYTVQFNAFPGATYGAIDFLLRNGALATVSSQPPFTPGTTSWTIPAGTLTPGQTYFGTIGFFNLSAPLAIDVINAGSIGSIGMATSLNFTIAAIPEPSTYAALAGLAALGLALRRRWRGPRL
jgi:hypothetical protein